MFSRATADHAAFAFALMVVPSCGTPSTKTMRARTSGKSCAESSRRYRAFAMSSSF
jgi:hypothetical protein